MSHFRLLVMIDRPEDATVPVGKVLDDVLEPYREDTEDRRFLQFEDTTPKRMNKYENDSATYIQKPDGSLILAWRDDPKVEDFPRVTVPFKEIYGTFEKFVTDWCGEEIDPETGRSGYWTNPNAKWDWWKIHGRWPGLIASEGFNYIDGVMEFSKVKGRYDFAILKNCDFSINQDDYDKAIKFWEHKVEGKDPNGDYGWRDDYKKEFYIDRYGDKDTYAKSEAIEAPFAVITPDGEWHEKGNMGWWGVSSETHEEARDWTFNFYDRFIKDADPETLLVIVDCHI